MRIGSGIAAIAVVGLAACGSSTTSPPSTTRPTTTTTVAAAIPAGTPACNATSLSGQGSRKSAAFGSAVGVVDLTNTGTSACALAGVPQLNLLNASGAVIVGGTSSGRPPSAPVLMKPGVAGAAVLLVVWVNWCGAPPGALTLQIITAYQPGQTS